MGGLLPSPLSAVQLGFPNTRLRYFLVARRAQAAGKGDAVAGPPAATDATPAAAVPAVAAGEHEPGADSGTPAAQQAAAILTHIPGCAQHAAAPPSLQHFLDGAAGGTELLVDERVSSQPLAVAALEYP